MDNSHARLWPLPKVIIPLSSQFSALNLSRVYCKVTHFSGDMQAFSALFSGGGKVFVFLDICPQKAAMPLVQGSRFKVLPTDYTDFHRFFSSFRGNRCWVETSLFSAHKVIIPLRSPLSVLNSKCAEQPSGNSEDVQSFPDGIVVRAGKATGAVLRRLSHRRHI